MDITRNVAVLGASLYPDRYSYKAIEMLKHYGYTIYPIHPQHRIILDLPTFPSVLDIAQSIHTVTIYLNERNSTQLIKDLQILKPVRVICNPGAENDVLKKEMEKQNITVLYACTLVLLRTGQF